MAAHQNPTEATAVILVGGKSSRMGRPKALLPFDGEPLIAHVLRNLQELFTEVVIVAAPGQELPELPTRLVRDDIAYQGPVSGMYHGLSAAIHEICFVTSCDAPFLNLALVSNLIYQISNYDVVVPFWEKRLQPLHAVYRRSCAPLLKDQLERGELRPIFLYDKVRTRKVHEEEILTHDPEGLSFLNMNSPEDYENALQLWEKRQRVEIETAPPSGAVIAITVELFGVARMLAKTQFVPLELSRDATLAEAFALLGKQFPALTGRIIDANGLTAGYSCNINGLNFERSPKATLHSGDRVLILSADAGG